MADDDSETICADCTGEPFLREIIRSGGVAGTCHYCGGDSPAIALEELADRIEAAFESHYRRTSDQPTAMESSMLADRESSYEWERRGDEVIFAIADAASIDEAVAADVQEILEQRHSDFEAAKMGEECEFADDSYYDRKGPDDIEFQLDWRRFERRLKTEARFFDKEAKTIFDKVFAGLSSHRTRGGGAVVQEAGPGQPIAALYRGRVFHSHDKLKEALKRPDIEIGSPPSKDATAGRMNSRGISVFYGALDARVAIAEIRPPGGSRVAVVRFEIIRPLKLLDLEALKGLYVEGSIFDRDYVGRLELAKFLESLSHRLSAPVMPDDEWSDYLITQAVADYLANEAELDGIIYPSVQQGDGALNVALFHHAARVETLDIPEGTEIDAYATMAGDEDFDCEYSVYEETPPPSPKPKPRPPLRGLFYDVSPVLWDADRDVRSPGLRVDLDGVEVHDVTGVQIVTTSHRVRRHRSEKRSLPF